MPAAPGNQTRRAKARWTLALAGLALLTAAMTALLMRPHAPGLRVEPAVAPASVARTNLFLVAGRLCLSGQTNAFTGLMLEHAAVGSLRSRSSVSNGLLHGLSEGWYTNGQLQVTEHFKEGISHGRRTKWYVTGAKMSEAPIIDGQLHGTFRRWHENGALTEQVEMHKGQAEGISYAYYPSGALKAQAKMQGGKPLEQQFWKDGEFKEETAVGK